jgi:hypothetical protein
MFVAGQGDGLEVHLLGEKRLLLVTEGKEVGLQSRGQRMQSATRSSDEAIEASAFEEGADGADAASALEGEGAKGRAKDAAEDQLTRVRAEEAIDRVVGRRGVMVQPVVEGGVRDTAALGKLTLGGIIGIGELLKGSADVRLGPTARVLA